MSSSIWDFIGQVMNQNPTLVDASQTSGAGGFQAAVLPTAAGGFASALAGALGGPMGLGLTLGPQLVGSLISLFSGSPNPQDFAALPSIEQQGQLREDSDAVSEAFKAALEEIFSGKSGNAAALGSFSDALRGSTADNPLMQQLAADALDTSGIDSSVPFLEEMVRNKYMADLQNLGFKQGSLNAENQGLLNIDQIIAGVAPQAGAGAGQALGGLSNSLWQWIMMNNMLGGNS